MPTVKIKPWIMHLESNEALTTNQEACLEEAEEDALDAEHGEVGASTVPRNGKDARILLHPVT